MILEIILLALFIIIPIVLFYKLIPMKYHLMAFVFGSLFAFAVAFIKGYSWHDLGFRLDNFMAADGYYYIMFFLAFGLCAYFKQNNYKMDYIRIIGRDNLKSNWALALIPAQEIIFRSILFPALLSFGLSLPWIILIMSFLFGFAHIPFHSWKIFALTLVLGTGISAIYVFFPNFYLVTILHGIVWITAHFFKII